MNKIWKFLKSLFVKPKDDLESVSVISEKNYSEIFFSQTEKIKKVLINDKISNNLDKNIKINVENLNYKIKNNIFYLDEVMTQMEGFEEYASYYTKLKDLKKQSEGNLKILFRMKETAPYFKATVKAILRHTDTVSELMNVEY